MAEGDRRRRSERRELTDHSCRNAFIGSMRPARQAGTKQAASATARKRALTAIRLGASTAKPPAAARDEAEADDGILRKLA